MINIQFIADAFRIYMYKRKCILIVDILYVIQELVLANCSLEGNNCANIAKIVKKHAKTLQILS